MSEVCKTSGLSESIGSSLLIMRDLPAPLIVLIVVMCVAGMTELMSNTATSSLLLPILADLVSISHHSVTTPSSMYSVTTIHYHYYFYY